MPTLLSSLIVLFLGFYFIKVLSGLVTRAMDRREFDVSLKGFIRSLINVALKIMLIITVAGMLGIHTTSFVAILGAAGLAIGLALQGSLANFAGGVLILFFKPYRVGDTIEAGGVSGQVVEIQIFNTVLRNAANRTIILPNGAVSNNTIVNVSKIGTSGHSFDVYFDISTDVEKVKRVLLEILQNHPEVISSLPLSCAVVQIGIGFIQVKCSYGTRFGIGDSVRDELLIRMMQSLEKEGIALLRDFPDRDPVPPGRV